MRYYVLCFSDVPNVAPHIIAEVVRDDDGEQREMSLASAIAGARSVIATRRELMTEPEGREALELWDRGDDTQFDIETEALLNDEENAQAASIRLVGPNDLGEPRRRRRTIMPRDEQRRALLIKAVGLRTMSRALQQTSRARRQEAASIRNRAQGGSGIAAVEKGG